MLLLLLRYVRATAVVIGRSAVIVAPYLALSIAAKSGRTFTV